MYFSIIILGSNKPKTVCHIKVKSCLDINFSMIQDPL